MMRFIAALCLGLATGCVSVLPEAAPPPARYLIDDVSVDAATGRVDWSLAVADPSATRAFDTARIAISREPGRIEYFAAGEWSDRAPRLIGSALVRSFENTGVVLSVGDRIDLPSADYVLQTDIRDFHVRNVDGRMTAQVTIFARLTDARSRVFGARRFAVAKPLSASDASDAARGLNEALSALLPDLVSWTLDEANSARDAA